MDQFFKHIMAFIVLMIALSSCKAQKFTTHAVQRGETLSSISRQYNVDTATILRYNKELKRGDQVKANTILVIPRGAKPTSDRPSADDKQSDDVVIKGDEPIGFTSHRVRKRETLYGIAQRFRISENEIKKYNPDLYSSQLERNMTLKIPQYRRTKRERDAISDADFETYTVAPQGDAMEHCQ